MGFRLRRSLRIAPGMRINLGKRSISISVGRKGAHLTVGTAGTRTTVGLPGTGLSVTHFEPRHHGAMRAPGQKAQPVPSHLAARHYFWVVVVLAFVAAAILRAVAEISHSAS